MSTEWRDSYTYPGTRVLVNKLGITDFDALRRVEYDFTRGRIQELRSRSAEGDFDLPHLQAIHRHIFQDVYA